MWSKKILFLTVLIGVFSNFIVASENPIDSLINLISISSEEEQTILFNELSHLTRNNPKQSIEYGEQSLLLAEKYNLKKQIFNAYINLSDAHQKHDTLNEALQYCIKALAVAKDINDSLLIARAHFVVGSNYSIKGYYQEALTHLLQSLKIVEKLYNEENAAEINKYLSFITNNIGNLYSRMGNTSKALEYYEYSLEKKTNLNDSLGIANMLNNIGLLYARNDNFNKAKEYYKRSLVIKEVIGDKKVIAETIFNIWALYIQQEKYKKALEYYPNVEDITSELTSRSKILMYNNLGEIYLELGQTEIAFESIIQAIDLAKKSKSIELLSKSNLLLSRCYFNMNDYHNAYIYQSKYITLNDSIKNSEITAKIAEMQAKYETEKKEKEIVILKKDQQLKHAELEKQKAIKLVYLASFTLIIIILILVISRIRVKQKRKQVELEKRNLENEQKLLRSQMNPHFIFNSLNSIQGFISSNDSFKAMGFLSKFGQLMRMILENSRENFISLDNEIETLRLYIDMEKLRYKDIFEYELLFDNNIDTENILIPPLIIQPFVENAIKHGLSPKRKNGKLTIRYSIKDSVLIIRVIDNGVGRGVNQVNHQPKVNNHKSLGIKLTYERLAILSKKTKATASFSIVDLMDNNNNPSGTEVMITIPQKRAFPE